MVNKGKYKLLSYVVEDKLIFYKSLNKSEKILAFSLIELGDFSPIISNLKKFLQERILNYYSIQINVWRGEKLILLNFEDFDKNRILKLFNLVNDQLLKCCNHVNFLKNNKLEQKFLDVIIKKINSKVQVLKRSDSILILNEGSTRILNFYCINLNYMNINSSLVQNLTNLIKNFNQKGYIIINYKISQNNVLYASAYIVELCNTDLNSLKFEEEINNFFEFELIEKLNVKLNSIFKFLWRNGLSQNRYFPRQEFTLFSEKKTYEYNFRSLNLFKLQLEQNLMKKKIIFKRISKNLIFIEEHLLLYYSVDLDYDVILKILKKYYNKYFVYFFILNEKNHDELLNIKKINNLEKMKIFTREEFIGFDFKVFKNNYDDNLVSIPNISA